MDEIPVNKIITGDNVSVLRDFPADCIDLTVTSPPYDNLRDYKGYSFDFENLAKELYRVTEEGGVVVWVVGDSTVNGSESGTSFRQALYFKEIGFNLHDTMIYQKNNFAFPPTNRYFNSFEYMFVFCKGTPTVANLIRVPTIRQVKNNNSTSQRQKDGTKTKTKYETGKDTRIKENVWIYETGNNKTTKDECAWEHPAMFPEKLASDHIKSWSNEGDIVLDPFMGSGTTAKAAKILGRNYIGIEIAPEYVKLSEERLRMFNPLF